VLVASCLLVCFLGQWCHIVAEVVYGFHTLVVGVLGVWYLDMRWRWERWIRVVLVVRLLKQRLLALFLLVKDLDGVLELCESCSFSINMLSSGFDMLSCYLPSRDSFLFLMKPLDLLLNSGQLFLFHNFIFEGFVLPVFNLNLLKLCVFLDDLN
jgi:hypothetical protein